MQATRTTILPVVVDHSGARGSTVLIDGFVGALGVGYAAGPPFGQPLLTWDDLDNYRISHRDVRRQAAGALYAALDRVAIHGQPPALMLSFEGLESSVLLAHPFWDDLERSVPGDLVVGVPARDVVILTGSRSGAGMEKLRRAVDRVFFAGGPHLLTRDLLVRSQRRWEVWRPPMSAAPGQSRPVAPSSAVPLSPPVSPVVRPRPAPPMSGPPAVPVSAAPAGPAPWRRPYRSLPPQPAQPVRSGPARVPRARTPRSSARVR